MPFAITTANLIETMKQPGCPACAGERRAARKAVDAFLWESMMEPASRENTMRAWGFCPAHTRLLVAADLRYSGLPLATNILYEQLHGRSLAALRSVPRQRSLAGRLAGWLRHILPAEVELPSPRQRVLPATAPCPICASVDQATQNTLLALFEELDRGTADVVQAYENSDGLCLPHLRQGLERAMQDYPRAAERLLDIATARLEGQRAAMREFIRKKNWEYRDESLTDAESQAWRGALTFYTGIPGESFSHKEALED